MDIRHCSRSGRSVALAAALLALAVVGAGPVAPTYGAARAPGAARDLPLAFEVNEGQTVREVDFVARGAGYTLFLAPAEVVLRLRTPKRAFSPGGARRTPASPAPTADGAVLQMAIVGGKRDARAVGRDPLPGAVTYLTAAALRGSVRRVASYGRVQYLDVYPGVDLVYYGNRGRLEYDFVLAPGVDPGVIRLEFSGATGMVIDGQDGALVLDTAGGSVRLHRPFVYQEGEHGRERIAAEYMLDGDGRIGFRLAAHDRARPLVIDPVLSYASYIGGSGNEWASGLAVDGDGYIYLAGATQSVDFPTQDALQDASAGDFDAFVVKLDPTGTAIVFATYVGGSDLDYGGAIAVDTAGIVHLTGSTESSDFPVLDAFQPIHAGNTDAFVATLDPSGTALLYATFLGGESADYGGPLALDAAGHLLVAGQTLSCGFPVTPDALQPEKSGATPSCGDRNPDAFLARLDATGALLYSTFLGGHGEETPHGIAVDASGIYLAGATYSADFPTMNAIQETLGGGDDGFITKLDPTGTTLIYSTYLGGTGSDALIGMAVDTTGAVHVTGATSSPDFPTVAPLQGSLRGSTDAVVARLNPSGSALVYSTYLGGNGSENGNHIAVDGAGRVHVVGVTNSADFPVLDAFQGCPGGGFDGFLTTIDAAGAALVASSYLGGSGEEDTHGIVFTAPGVVHVIGSTSSGDFPVANALQGVFGGVNDGFLARVDLLASDGIAPTVAITSATAVVHGVDFAWAGDDDATPVACLQYARRLDPLETSFTAFDGATTASYAALPAGSYTLLVKARDQGGNESTVASASVLVAPDLRVSTVSEPVGSVVAGGSLEVHDVTRNSGLATAGAATTRYYLSADAAKGAGDVFLPGGRTTPGLAVGTSSSGTAVVAVPLVTPPGTYRLLACANDDGVVVELDHANNCLASSGTIDVALPPGNGDPDGVPDAVEAGAPNGGDGNGDGVADSEQANVASLLAAIGEDYVTLAAPEAVVLGGVQGVGTPPDPDVPDGVVFPVGFYSFTASGFAPGQATTVMLILPPGTVAATYFKYGPTPENPDPHWYEFLFDGTTGAEISGNVIALHLVDGQRGDDDLVANGIIIDLGAPGQLSPLPAIAALRANTVAAPGLPARRLRSLLAALDRASRLVDIGEAKLKGVKGRPEARAAHAKFASAAKALAVFARTLGLLVSRGEVTEDTAAPLLAAVAPIEALLDVLVLSP